MAPARRANYAQVPRVAICDRTLTHSHFRVFVYVHDVCGGRPGGLYYRSNSTAGGDLKMNEKSVARALDALVNKGYLRRNKRPGITDEYTVNEEVWVWNEAYVSMLQSRHNASTPVSKGPGPRTFEPYEQEEQESEEQLRSRQSAEPLEEDEEEHGLLESGVTGPESVDVVRDGSGAYIAMGGLPWDRCPLCGASMVNVGPAGSECERGHEFVRNSA